MSSSPFWTINNNFYPEANSLRTIFCEAFESPLETRSERFCWDYWYVKNQYKLLRTPAEHFFGEDEYTKFESALIKWGQENLGCSAVSPIWLSYYVDGCEQQMHSDSPHGPWAFVYSLTDWENKSFSGGETFLLKPETLCYWDYFDTKKGVEQPDLIELIPPLFNQLTVFDPRFPHGVKQVQGVSEPSKSRIVMHGWFTEPSPQVFGSLTLTDCEDALDAKLEVINNKLSSLGKLSGLLSLKLSVNKDGHIEKIETLCNTLVEISSEWGDDEIIDYLNQELKNVTLPKSYGESSITLPFLFK